MMGVIFVLGSFAFVAINQSFAVFMASPFLLICTALLVVGLVFLAVFMPRGTFTTSS